MTAPRRTLLAGLAALHFAPRPAMAVGLGSGRIDVAEAVGATDAPMTVWYHRPADWPPAGRVVVVMHGLNRTAELYRDQWRELANAGRFLLLVPEFTAAKFPGLRWYQYGNVLDADGQPNPPAAWTFQVLDRVVGTAMRMAGAQRTMFALYGHSAGAQFVHRYLLLTGAQRAESVVIANAGAFTLPRSDRPFPEGLAGVTVPPTLRQTIFSRHVVLLLGEADTDPAHRTLPRQPWAQAQGSHRFARGWYYFDTMRLAAEAQGALFTWRVVTVPGVGHSNGGMAAFAAAQLFSTS